MKSRKFLIQFLFLLGSTLFSQISLAGDDGFGVVTKIMVKADGLYFSIPGIFPNRCLPGWNGLNFLVPANSPDYINYYGLVLASKVKKFPLYIANLSTFNGTGICDVTKTGYGIVLQ